MDFGEKAARVAEQAFFAAQHAYATDRFRAIIDAIERVLRDGWRAERNANPILKPYSREWRDPDL